MSEIIYPNEEKIVEYNFLVLELIKVKRADSPKTLSASKIREVIKECKDTQGDIYDKAVVLLKGLVQKHPFASGNRRTAFIVTKDFVISNNHKFNIEDNPHYARALQGVRENYYTHEEIKEWIKNGKIKKFER